VREIGIWNPNNTTTDTRRALKLLAFQVGALVLLLALAWVTRARVMEGIYSKDVTEFDASVLHTLRGRSTSVTDNLFVVASWIGSPAAIVVIALAGVLVLAPRVRPALLGTWLAAVGGSGVLSVSLKHIFQRARPAGASEFLHGLSFSFPSTHTVASLVTGGTVCYLLCSLVVQRPSRRLLTVLAFTLLVAVIASSRLVLGVHFFSDVCAGLVVGCIWLCICIGSVEYERRTLPDAAERAPRDSTAIRLRA
jgi:membrane-associated phospholipid phosphatase